MDLSQQNIQHYCEAHTSPENELLAKLNRETHAKILSPRMLSGHLQGRLLSFLSKMIAPSRILEIGTYTGYSTLCLAEGLSYNGKITTIDVNEELEGFTQSFFNQSPYAPQIEYIIGNALELIASINDEFDLVFIDADKKSYSIYYDLVFPKLKEGAYILADNVLWSGHIINPDRNDKDTLALRHFNEKIKDDERVEKTLLPIRDGLMMIRKK